MQYAQRIIIFLCSIVKHITGIVNRQKDLRISCTSVRHNRLKIKRYTYMYMYMYQGQLIVSPRVHVHVGTDGKQVGSFNGCISKCTKMDLPGGSVTYLEAPFCAFQVLL